MRCWIEINRAPVLTIWAAVVAMHLGFDWEEALPAGRAVAGLNAYSNGKALGLCRGIRLRPSHASFPHEIYEGELHSHSGW